MAFADFLVSTCSIWRETGQALDAYGNLAPGQQVRVAMDVPCRLVAGIGYWKRTQGIVTDGRAEAMPQHTYTLFVLPDVDVREGDHIGEIVTGETHDARTFKVDSVYQRNRTRTAHHLSISISEIK